MSAEQWQREKAIFSAALELETAAREAYLEAACDGDAALRERIVKLLAAHAAPDFLDHGVRIRKIRQTDLGMVGRRLGRYRLEEEIGRGGMGRVFRAERDDAEFRQTVAVKVLRSSAVDGETLRRFFNERQILASLEHPYVARLIDGGEEADGVAYLVMEYVDGQPIDTYCEARRLTLRRKLALFRKVCSAVSFAHRNLVIHRDLKPSNVLVTRDGHPKLLDFGIAKLVAPEAFRSLVGETATALRPMTLAYASPEQVGGDVLTTASDVYALGVLLFELLTGECPYRSVSGHSGSSPRMWVRAICEEEPTRPSERVLQAASPPRPAAESRRLHRSLKGDLDNIALRAMHKEPSRRYASVEQLSEDVGRYLEGLPVSARPDTLGYRLGKFVRRNKLVSAAAVLVVALLVTVTWLLFQVMGQKREVGRQKEAAEQTADFALSLFELADPGVHRGSSIPAARLLERGEERLRHGFEGQPQTRARMLDVLGSMYLRLGLYERAAPLLEEALSLRREWLPSHDPALAQSVFHLAELYRVVRDRDRAQPLYEEALALRRKPSGGDGIEVAEVLGGLGKLIGFHSRPLDAAAYFEEALAIYRQDPSASEGRAEMTYYVASVRDDQGRGEEAGALFEETLELARTSLGDDHPLYAKAVYGFGIHHFLNGRVEEAEPWLRQAVERLRGLYGPNDHRTVRAVDVLARLFGSQGRLAEAEPLLAAGVESARSDLIDLPLFADLALLLASARMARGELDAAQALLDEVEDWRGAGHPPLMFVGQLRSQRAELAIARGDAAAGEAQARLLLDERRAALDAGDPLIDGAEELLAYALSEQGRWSEAEELYHAIARRKAERLDDDEDLRHLDVWLGLANSARARGDLETAWQWMDRCRRVTRQRLPESSWHRAKIESMAGELLYLRGNLSEAAPLLRASRRKLEEILGPSAPETLEATRRLDLVEVSSGGNQG